MGYFLTTEAMRVVERDERGRIVKRTRFKKGDEVTGLDEARVEALLDSGALVEGEEDVDSSDADAGAPGPVPTQAALDSTEGADDDAPEPDSTGDDEEVEDFASMEYSDLQRLAKDRTGDGSGGREALIARLTAHAASDN